MPTWLFQNLISNCKGEERHLKLIVTSPQSNLRRVHRKGPIDSDEIDPRPASHR